MKASKSPYSAAQLEQMYHEESVRKEHLSSGAAVYTARYSDGIKGFHIVPAGKGAALYAANSSQYNKIIKAL